MAVAQAQSPDSPHPAALLLHQGLQTRNLDLIQQALRSGLDAKGTVVGWLNKVDYPICHLSTWMGYHASRGERLEAVDQFGARAAAALIGAGATANVLCAEDGGNQRSPLVTPLRFCLPATATALQKAGGRFVTRLNGMETTPETAEEVYRLNHHALCRSGSGLLRSLRAQVDSCKSDPRATREALDWILARNALAAELMHAAQTRLASMNCLSLLPN